MRFRCVMLTSLCCGLSPFCCANFVVLQLVSVVAACFCCVVARDALYTVLEKYRYLLYFKPYDIII